MSEPRNRSALMAPPNHTSLVAELPCNESDELWHDTDDAIVPTAGVARHTGAAVLFSYLVREPGVDQWLVFQPEWQTGGRG